MAGELRPTAADAADVPGGAAAPPPGAVPAADVTVPVPGATVPVPGGPARRRRSAGRNLGAAVGVGLGLGALVLGTLFTYRASFMVVIMAATAVASLEVRGALVHLGMRVPRVPLVAACGAFPLLAWYEGRDGLVVGMVAGVLVVLAWRLAGRPAGYAADVGAGLFTLFYLPFLAGFATLMLRPEDGARRLLLFLILPVANDIGGYAAGVLFGRHPLARRVSPKKTWEGLAGSALACGVAGGLGLPLLLHGRWWQGVLLGLATLVTATAGDLGESLLKRDAGIKDMSSLLPGHGGLMDRMDSLLPTAPVVWLMMSWFVPAALP